ncbi:MAG: glycosyltransferase family 2 protein [Flavobacteriales bacterium]
MKYSIVVPVFNAEKCLDELVERVVKTVNSITSEYEIILVDDYSEDNSWEIIKKHKKKFPEIIKGIRLSKNFGQHNATFCGIKHASGEFIITLDDDLEYDPEDIKQLIDAQKNSEAQLVYGESTKKKNSWIRTFFTLLYKLFSRSIHGKNKGRGSSFRLMKSSLAKSLLNNIGSFSFIDEFCQWHTNNIAFVSITSYDSKRGKSRYSLFKLSLITSEVILFSSVFPLRIITGFGFLIALVNFLLGLFFIVKRLFFNIEVEGYTSLIVAVLFSTGLIILSLGVIAEYISKILKSQHHKPAFFEEKIL